MIPRELQEKEEDISIEQSILFSGISAIFLSRYGLDQIQVYPIGVPSYFSPYLISTCNGFGGILRHREGTCGTCVGELDEMFPTLFAGKVNAVGPRTIAFSGGAAGKVGWAEDVSAIAVVNVALGAHLGLSRN